MIIYQVKKKWHEKISRYSKYNKLNNNSKVYKLIIKLDKISENKLNKI